MWWSRTAQILFFVRFTTCYRFLGSCQSYLGDATDLKETVSLSDLGHRPAELNRSILADGYINRPPNLVSWNPRLYLNCRQRIPATAEATSCPRNSEEQIEKAGVLREALQLVHETWVAEWGNEVQRLFWMSQLRDPIEVWTTQGSSSIFIKSKKNNAVKRS